jgi:hypothetical protein
MRVTTALCATNACDGAVRIDNRRSSTAVK